MAAVSTTIEWMGRRGLVAAVLIASILRIGWVILVPIVPQSDGNMYDVFAQRIAQGLGYSYPDGSVTVYWAVGPAALYGAVYALAGHTYAAAAFLNVLMGTALVWITGLLATQQFGRHVGWLAALLLAVWPLWIQFSTIISSELPFTFMLCAALAVERAGQRPWRGTTLSTLLLVGASYMRPIALPLIVGLPFLRVFAGEKVSRAFFRTALAVVLATLLMAPWALRNRDYFGAPVLVSANFGANLWMGNNPQSNGGFMPLPDEAWRNELVRDADMKQRSLRYIVEHPLNYAQLCLARLRISFDRESIGVVWNNGGLPQSSKQPLKALSSAWWLLMFGTSLIGAAVFVWAAPIRFVHPLIVVPALILAVALFVVGQDRYHVPAGPFVSIFAAFAICRGGKRFAAKHSARTWTLLHTP